MARFSAPFADVCRLTVAATFAAASLALSTSPVLAQTPAASTAPIPVPTEHAAVKRATDLVRTDNAWTLQQQTQICEIPAPPFGEEVRAADYKRRLEAEGLTNVRIDSVGNVIAERVGTGGGPVVVLSAHLDTVFPEGTDVTVKQDGDMYAGPGIGDDCRGLAVVLAVARAYRQADIKTAGTILFVGTVGEEGAGNLRGVRHLFEGPLKGTIDYFISVDGTGLNITHAAVGSNRYRVRFIGPGGHSYGAFGMPNPMHAMGRAIAKLADVQVPASPRTTFSVGVVEGGTSVNSIPFEATMDVDLRSESAQSLATLDSAFQRAVQEGLAEERARWPQSQRPVDVKIDTIGIRPAGSQPETAPIVVAAIEAGKALGFEPFTGASSTDSNVPIGLGIPAITIDGGGQARGAHSLDEVYRDGPDGWKGPQWAILIVAALAGAQ